MAYPRRFKSSTVRPMSFRMPLSRPFLSVRLAWIGTVTRRPSLARFSVRWLPRWWDGSNPSRFRIESSSRAVRTGSFSPPMRGRNAHPDGANELIGFLRDGFSVFQKAFEMTLDGFADIRLRFLEGVSLAVTAWKRRAKGVIPACFIRFDHDGKPVHLQPTSFSHHVPTISRSTNAVKELEALAFKRGEL